VGLHREELARRRRETESSKEGHMSALEHQEEENLEDRRRYALPVSSAELVRQRRGEPVRQWPRRGFYGLTGTTRGEYPG